MKRIKLILLSLNFLLFTGGTSIRAQDHSTITLPSLPSPSNPSTPVIGINIDTSGIIKGISDLNKNVEDMIELGHEFTPIVGHIGRLATVGEKVEGHIGALVPTIQKGVDEGLEQFKAANGNWAESNKHIGDVVEHLNLKDLGLAAFTVAAAGALGVGVVKGVIGLASLTVNSISKKISDHRQRKAEAERQEQLRMEQFKQDMLKSIVTYEKLLPYVAATAKVVKSIIELAPLKMTPKEQEEAILNTTIELKTVRQKLEIKQKLLLLEVEKEFLNDIKRECTSTAPELSTELKKVNTQIAGIDQRLDSLEKAKKMVGQGTLKGGSLCEVAQKLHGHLQDLEESLNKYRNEFIQVRDLAVNNKLKSETLYLDSLAKIREEKDACRKENRKLCEEIIGRQQKIIRDHLWEKIDSCTRKLSTSREHSNRLMHNFFVRRLSTLGGFDYNKKVEVLRSDLIGLLQETDEIKNPVVGHLLQVGTKGTENLGRLLQHLEGSNSEFATSRAADIGEMKRELEIIKKRYEEEVSRFYSEEEADYPAMVEEYNLRNEGRLSSEHPNWTVCKKMLLEDVVAKRDEAGKETYLPYGQFLSQTTDQIKANSNLTHFDHSVRIIDGLLEQTVVPFVQPAKGVKDVNEFLLQRIQGLIQEKMAYDGGRIGIGEIKISKDDWDLIVQKIRPSLGLKAELQKACH